MTKNELRNGMFVQLENGDWYMVSKGVEIGSLGYIDAFVNIQGGFMDMERYSNDLRRGSNGYSVKKVVKPEYFNYVLSQLIDGKTPDKFSEVKVLWERSNPKIIEVESLISKLQGQLEAAKAELEALR